MKKRAKIQFIDLSGTVSEDNVHTDIVGPSGCTIESIRLDQGRVNILVSVDSEEDVATFARALRAQYNSMLTECYLC